MNNLILIGRLTRQPEIQEKENGGKVSYITLAVQRQYKNIEGIYETDFISVILYNGISSNVCEYCQKGDLLGIKGRLETRDNKVVVIADKVTFLSNSKG